MPLAAQPRWVSRICPTFIRLGTPSGLSTMSTARAVLEERHVLHRQDLGDHALVAVAAGHLVADGQLALDRHVDLHELDHAGRQVVALLQALDLGRVPLVDLVDLGPDLVGDPPDLVLDRPILDADAIVQLDRQLAQVLGRVRLARRDELASASSGSMMGAVALRTRSGSWTSWRRAESLDRADLLVAIALDAPHRLPARSASARACPSRRPSREKTWAPMTVPSTPGRDAEGGVAHVPGLLAEDGPEELLFRERAGSPPSGVILPTRMSPCLTSAPMHTMPDSSRSLRASSPTLGMSRVISSLPSLVSRAATSNSSMWIVVYRSSRTRRSEIRMESSKLYPPHGMKATSDVLAERQLPACRWPARRRSRLPPAPGHRRAAPPASG